CTRASVAHRVQQPNTTRLVVFCASAGTYCRLTSDYMKQKEITSRITRLKLTYGYKLPSSESDIFYVQVLFRMLSAEPMTYPSCCVRPGGLRPAPSRDRPPTGAVRQFAIDTLSYSRRLFADFQLRLIDPDKDVATVVADNAAASTASQSTAIATASKLQTQKPNAVVPRGV
uniref:DUF4708 domain-containing protein n=1 Tax=Macrostomum lignano TaxID=282301 RepID=A0A1I8IHR3_9PLAT